MKPDRCTLHCLRSGHDDPTAALSIAVRACGPVTCDGIVVNDGCKRTLVSPTRGENLFGYGAKGSGVTQFLPRQRVKDACITTDMPLRHSNVTEPCSPTARAASVISYRFLAEATVLGQNRSLKNPDRSGRLDRIAVHHSGYRMTNDTIVDYPMCRRRVRSLPGDKYRW